MKIQFKNITFIFTEVPRGERTIGSFHAQYKTETFKKVVEKYDQFCYFRLPEVFETLKDSPTVDSLGINHLIMFIHFCIHFESERKHEIFVQSDSPFFIIHDAFHALTDVVLYDKVEGCEPFYRLSCQAECEGKQLLAAYKFMHDNNIPVSEKYLQEVEKAYVYQNNKPLGIINYKNQLTT